ncbi:MAG: PfkB family carbohydrate kinase [Candidatus Thorarchaeota archaeon]|nr:PfkB family carbohydrate kinase [Candidatus Thorarchaeota archaeon]
MYDLLVIGNPVSLIKEGHLPGEIVLGPSVVAASIAARLGVLDMVLAGNVPPMWREHLIADLDRYTIPEHYFVDSQAYREVSVPTPDGVSVRIAVSDERISIRNFPEEFLTAKAIVLAPFGDEIDPELAEWIASSSTGTILWDPGLFRLRQDEAIPLSPERGDLVRFLKSVDIVSINIKEGDALVGASDPHIAAELLVEWGATTSIVTDGSNGSILYDGTDFISVPAYPIENAWRCWTGAAFVAGLTYGVIHEERITDSTALASSVASIFIEQADRYAPIDFRTVKARKDAILEGVSYK